MYWNRLAAMAVNDTQKGTNHLIGRMIARQRPAGPAFNIWVNDEGAVLTSEIPGVELQDLDITVSGKSVSVKGIRKDESTEKEERYSRKERASGEFERIFRLGMEIDAAAVQARLANGVLEIRLPRSEKDKPRKITVTAD